jgi:phosphinothricin acetyltransferase
MKAAMTAEIRLAVDRDAAAIADIYAPFVELSATSFETEAPTADEIRRRVQETTITHPWLVCVCGDSVSGYAYATKHRIRTAYQWSVETSVYVHGSFRRAGVGRGLYTSLFAILAAQGFVHAYAGITLPNESSVALHESLGFRPVGVYRTIGYKAGAWHDVGWWHFTVKEPPASPKPPVLLADIQRQPGWDAMLSAGMPLIRAQDARGHGSV